MPRNRASTRPLPRLERQPPLPHRLPLAAAIALAFSGPLFAQPSTPQGVTWPALKLERALNEKRDAQAAQPPSFARADHIEGSPEDKLILRGDAELRYGATVMRGHTITYTRATDEVEAEGDAQVSRGGAVFTGPSLNYKVDAQTGEMPRASYTYAPRRLRGTSSLLEFLGEGRTRLDEAKLTTCRPGDESWWVQAEKLELDDFDESATGSSARIYFKNVPIFAAPWFSFPIGDKRKSGVLTPGLAMSSTLGLDIKIPYYWNIAPNYDYTITPRLMSKRGLMLGNELRYLEPEFRGTLRYEVLNNDRVTGTKRDAFSLHHEYSSPTGLMAGVNYNRVSDDSFLTDFSSNIVDSSQTVLPQDAYVGFNQPLWNTALRVTKNQTLRLPGVAYSKPYEREPQATFNTYLADWKGFEVAGLLEATRFVHPDMPSGTRSIINPRISYPILRPGWFVIPKAQYLATWYSMDNSSSGAIDKSSERLMPIASLDSGLIFERDTTWFGRASQQTLEPRLYYAYTPYRDQSRLPNFDSAFADFNFAQLFTENIYSGYDRISEANQVSATLTTRYLDSETGDERLRAAIGQRYYFSDQRVTLPGQPAPTNLRSDLLASVGAKLARHWSADISAQYSAQLGQFTKVTGGVRWQPRAASVLGVYYRYNLSPTDPTGSIKQIDVAAQWPLTRDLYGVARYNYSLLASKPIESLAGLEYRADCWILRAVAQRYTTSTQTETSTFFLQLELSGLGGVGVNPLEALQRNIPGYQALNPLPREPGRFEFYE
ncbi:MAG: LPS-assembly protein LptD [Burkholderiaceae bacterium]